MSSFVIENEILQFYNGGERDVSEFEIENGVLKKYNGAGGDVVIPPGVTAIGDGAFKADKALRSVVMHAGIDVIGDEVFARCDHLQSVTFPDCVSHFGKRVLSGCKSLSEVTLPVGVFILEAGDLRGCHSLVSLTVPDSLTEVKNKTFRNKWHMDVFDDCRSLCEIHASDAVFKLMWDAAKKPIRYMLCLNCLKAGIEWRECQKNLVIDMRKYFVENAIREHRAMGLDRVFSLKKVPLWELDDYIADSKNAAEVLAFLLDYKNTTYTAEDVERYEAQKADEALGVCEQTTADQKRKTTS